MIIIHEAKENPVANLCPEPSSPNANVLKLQRVSCNVRRATFYAMKNGLGASDAWGTMGHIRKGCILGAEQKTGVPYFPATESWLVNDGIRKFHG